jgi:hypothetical protein
MLFATTADDWEKARGFLLQAQEAYARAQDTAGSGAFAGPGDADREQVPNALVKNDFRGYA